MKLDKMIEDYNSEYGDISDNKDERESYLLSVIKPSYMKKIEESVKSILGIKWKCIDITLYLVPKATPRPRATKFGVFYVSGAKDNKAFFHALMEDKTYEYITTPCKFICDCYIPTPSSFSKIDKYLCEKGLIRPVSKPDWDNLGKTYSDMIQGILLMDDSLIIEGISRKFYSIKPRIEIRIEYMESFDSKVNEKRILNRLERK